MSNEFYIAKRLSSRKHGERAGVMERVATIATAISLMVIVVTLSVVVGFKESVDAMLSGASADVVVTAPQSMGTLSPVLLERSEELVKLLDREPVARYSPYLAKEGVIKSDDNIVGVVLKGVDSLYDFAFFEKYLVEGALPRIGREPRSRDVMLSVAVAEKMDIGVGERIEMLFIDPDDGLLRDRFEVCGLFKSGLDVIDDALIISDIRNLERFYANGKSAVTGYELWLRPDVDTEACAELLNQDFITLYYDYEINAEAFTLQTIYPNLFGWLATHDVNALFISIIMIIVALLNMTAALLIIVLERQTMIGELRAMGMNRWSVVRVFVFRAMFIVMRGVGWGTLCGIALVVVQHIFGVMPLPAEGYILSTVPVAMCWRLWVLAVVVATAVTMLVLILPSLYAARVSPAKAIRYE